MANDSGENTNDFTLSGEVDVSFDVLGDGAFVKASVSIGRRATVDFSPILSCHCFKDWRKTIRSLNSCMLNCFFQPLGHHRNGTGQDFFHV